MIDEDFEFVKKQIESCENEWQMECATQMVSLFNSKHKNLEYFDKLLGVILEANQKQDIKKAALVMQP